MKFAVGLALIAGVLSAPTAPLNAREVNIKGPFSNGALVGLDLGVKGAADATHSIEAGFGRLLEASKPDSTGSPSPTQKAGQLSIKGPFTAFSSVGPAGFDLGVKSAADVAHSIQADLGQLLNPSKTDGSGSSPSATHNARQISVDGSAGSGGSVGAGLGAAGLGVEGAAGIAHSLEAGLGQFLKGPKPGGSANSPDSILNARQVGIGGSAGVGGSAEASVGGSIGGGIGQTREASISHDSVVSSV
ncbi:hypothetical protein BDW62DRAFT_176735 [Aspergillus aurantiobrunneus]